jgi:nifR3 family TIM-barrel protein
VRGRPDALVIGSLVLDTPVVLAPMAGITNQSFRRLCRRFGGGLYVSEMLTSRSVVEGNARTLRMASFADDEAVRSVQLYGVDPTVVARAVHRLVEEMGVEHIDLNFGCPVPKVTRHGGGAALPVHLGLFGSIVRAAVRAAGPAPVTVKMRVGIDEDHRTSVAAGQVAEGEGVAAVALHARTARQLYAGSADWSAIAELKQAVPTIPVLGNGDIWDATDAVRMMAQTDCDGVVIGRGCLGRPWLFGALDAVLSGLPEPAEPKLGDVVHVMVDHAGLLVDELGEAAALRSFRKHVRWYLQDFPVAEPVLRSAQQTSTLAELAEAIGGLEPTVSPEREARDRVRGPTRGPQRRVALPDRWLERSPGQAAPAPSRLAEAAVSGG